MPVSPPTFAEAAKWWLRLGFISFGGPAGQIATMHQELVERKRWISEGRFQHALGYCTVLPGPEAQQLATYIGWLLHGIPGGLVAGGLFVLPSFFILVGLTWSYQNYGTVAWVAALFAGIKPAVVAIVLLAAYRIGKRSIRTSASRGLAVVSFGAALAGVPFPIVVLAALVLGSLVPSLAVGGGHGKILDVDGEFVIADGVAPPAHALVSGPRIAAVLALGLVIGALPIPFLGEQLREMASFFTGLAFLTLGGAYAVLPYLHDGAIAHGWLAPGQMLDGLALGETTPGPLIMVVTFVGYLGAGFAGAVVATAYTFLPSFVFILAGGPFVERAREIPRLAAPLGAVSAAVVGVILNLAWVLAQHVVFAIDGVDWRATSIVVASAVALIRYEVGINWVLLGGALAGLASLLV